MDSYKANGVERKGVSLLLIISFLSSNSEKGSKNRCSVAADGGYSADFEEPDDDGHSVLGKSRVFPLFPRKRITTNWGDGR